MDGQQQCPTTLHIYKSPTGKYSLSTLESADSRIASFDNAGEHLPAILTQLNPQDDHTVSDPLDVILSAIHAQLSIDLNENWTKYLIPCHRDSAMKATVIKKAIERELGHSASKELLKPFQERVLAKSGHATRILLNPHGQSVKLRA